MSKAVLPGLSIPSEWPQVCPDIMYCDAFCRRILRFASAAVSYGTLLKPWSCLLRILVGADLLVVGYSYYSYLFWLVCQEQATS